MTTEARVLPINAHVIALDETNHSNISPSDKPHIAKIMGVYLYDENEITYCCELTASYYLIHLYDVVVLTGELDEEKEAALYEKYENQGGDNIYVYCCEIDALVKMKGPGGHYHYGTTGVGYDASDHEEQMEGLREHFCANHVV